MRKVLFLFILASAGILTAFTVSNTPNSPQDKPKLEIGAPGDVTAVLENSCYGCHNDGSQNEKSKAKLNFSKWNDLDKVKKISELNEIAEVIKEGTMPPQKFLANYPDKALTKEQGELINKWIDDYSSKLMQD
jgi:hypothetical protein